MNSNDVLDKFFTDQNEEVRNKRQKITDGARSEERVDLKLSGTYRMKVDSFCYTKNNIVTAMPELRISENKKALMLAIPLRVVDGTPYVPKGALFYTNIVISPPEDASDEKFKKTMDMAKPRLAALLGHKNLQYDKAWLKENLTPEFKSDGSIHTLVRDHNLKNEVMVEVVDGFYDNRDRLEVKSIRPAAAHDKSVSNAPKGQDPNDVDKFDKLMDSKNAPEDKEAAAAAAESVNTAEKTETGGTNVVNLEDY